MAPTFRLEIDDDSCGSHGRCWALAPHLFEEKPGGEGRGQVKEALLEESLRSDAERAVQMCPENAIRIIEVQP